MLISAVPSPRASAAWAAQRSSPSGLVSTVEAVTLRSPLNTRTEAPAIRVSSMESTRLSTMLMA